MKKQSCYNIFTCIFSFIIVVTTCFTSLAGEWEPYGSVRRYKENGEYLTNTWRWIDDNADGIAECYYFTKEGHTSISAHNLDGSRVATPDGYYVNMHGQWVVDSCVQRGVFDENGQIHLLPVEKVEPGWELTDSGWKYRLEDGTYAWDTEYLIDGNKDGIYEIYTFDENGILYQDKGGKNYNKFGSFDSEGRLITTHYKGGSAYDLGPYEVVQKNGSWYCVNGTIPSEIAGCNVISDDYAWDAVLVKGWIDYDILARQSVSYTEYIN